jgi:diguanylate cyclase (GGDEF)-like protein
VGAVAGGNVRASDMAGRFGGEEFALLLPETTARSAGVVVDRVRERLTTLPIAGGDDALTISFGLVEFPAAGSTMRELMHAADIALYDAKEAGRDRVVHGRASDRAHRPLAV